MFSFFAPKCRHRRACLSLSSENSRGTGHGFFFPVFSVPKLSCQSAHVLVLNCLTLTICSLAEIDSKPVNENLTSRSNAPSPSICVRLCTNLLCLRSMFSSTPRVQSSTIHPLLFDGKCCFLQNSDDRRHVFSGQRRLKTAGSLSMFQNPAVYLPRAKFRTNLLRKSAMSFFRATGPKFQRTFQQRPWEALFLSRTIKMSYVLWTDLIQKRRSTIHVSKKKRRNKKMCGSLYQHRSCPNMSFLRPPGLKIQNLGKHTQERC
jgi:hypothetical protein